MVDFERHSRHITLPNVGIEGQKKLRESKIVCVGAGGLGTPVIQYLAAAGVGEITIIDDDIVNLSNLQRQVIHRTKDVGIAKVESAKRYVNDLDPSVKINSINARITSENSHELFKGHDLIIDGTDNIETRYIIDDTSKETQIPWIYGSVYRFEGQVSLFNFSNGPSYRDLFPEAPPKELIPNCADAGVFGVLPGMIGCIQASEAIKFLLGIGTPLSGKLLVYDVLENTQKLLNFQSNSNEQVEEPNPFPEETMFNRVDAADAIQKMGEGWSPLFIDVRSELEWDQNRITGAQYLCPHTEVLSKVESLPKDQDILVTCGAGVRSEMAIMQLLSAGFDGSKLFNLEGGIMGWAQTKPEDIIHG